MHLYTVCIYRLCEARRDRWLSRGSSMGSTVPAHPGTGGSLRAVGSVGPIAYGYPHGSVAVGTPSAGPSGRGVPCGPLWVPCAGSPVPIWGAKPKSGAPSYSPASGRQKTNGLSPFSIDGLPRITLSLGCPSPTVHRGESGGFAAVQRRSLVLGYEPRPRGWRYCRAVLSSKANADHSTPIPIDDGRGSRGRPGALEGPEEPGLRRGAGPTGFLHRCPGLPVHGAVLRRLDRLAWHPR